VDGADARWSVITGAGGLCPYGSGPKALRRGNEWRHTRGMTQFNGRSDVLGLPRGKVGKLEKVAVLASNWLIENLSPMAATVKR
jgi:hypothetical protein